jgi:hypothetical protein
MSLKNWLQGQKDNSVSFLAEKMLAKRLEPYGRLVSFKLNSRERSATLELLLDGEKESVTVEVQEYVMAGNPNGTSIMVKRARASRPWLNTLLADFVLGRPFPVPEQYAAYLRNLL